MNEAAPDIHWYKDALVYEVQIRSFFDANNDGVGDIPGLTAKLDYLKDLGITAIWLLPFYPSPMRDDGYDIADYNTVNPIYGNLDDFKRFLDAAHDRGLRVITELVINHTSDQHAWFQRARRSPPGSVERDFYVWSDTQEKYRDTRIIFQDYETSNWTFDNVAGAYYWHRFFHHQPDLNFDNPVMRQALFQVLDFWMAMGIDAHVQPEPHDVEDRLEHGGVVEVQVRLMREEAVPVVLVGLSVERPVGLLGVHEDDAGASVLRVGVAPDVVVAFGRALRGVPCPLEPGVLIRGVVDHQLCEHADVEPVGGVEEALEVVQRPVHRIDRGVIRDVVSVVSKRRWIEGQQPDARDAKIAEIRQLLGKAGEVADAVAVAVVEAADVRFVNDRVLEPVSHRITNMCAMRSAGSRRT